MTATQQARLEGFRASLEQRGQSLTLNGAGASVVALVEVATPDGYQFRLAKEEANASRVYVLREDLDVLSKTPGVGDVWQDDVTGGRYRITEAEDQPVNIANVYHCETVTAS